MHTKEQLLEHLKNSGINNQRVLAAISEVPREEFVPEHLKEMSYADTALPIGKDQTISQPYTVAFMTALLDPKESDRILEIGTGSGYQAAVLAKLAKEVYSTEIIPELYKKAEERLEKLDIKNVKLFNKSGFKGLNDYAPYDAIMVTAGSTQIPNELLSQLKIGGKLVIPVGGGSIKRMLKITRRGDDFSKESYGAFSFVPLVK
ncbi:protein-L-isoaspartate(D-aspartate) O-methyltransferase [candidate division WWE3 bacterium]|nr:protein-L-isoaspartate(D-aspartate) O-methyltransferase [candidate division WWE3 bacterium]